MMMIDLNKAVSLAVVALLALILMLGSLSTSYSQVFAKAGSSSNNGKDGSGSGSGSGSGDGSGNNNDNNQNSNPGDSNNPGNDQQPPKDQQPPADVGVNPQPPAIDPLLPVTPPEKIDCSKTPDDPSCKPKDIVPPVDCSVTPNDPACLKHCLALGCPGSPPAPGPIPIQGPDKDCQFHPELDKCKSDNGKCPPGFSNNGNDHCYKTGPCPPGFAREDNDESGACKPKHPPIIICPPGTHRDDHKCIINCPPGFHPRHGICTKVIIIHKHIKTHVRSNTDVNSMVTSNTHLTDDLTVGEAIDGCKDVNSNSAKDLQKSCDIFMVSTFNYCLTHQSIAHKDSNICSDPLYVKNVPQYIDDNNVNLKLFPPTIYNIVP
jgi:hypothetical protein